MHTDDAVPPSRWLIPLGAAALMGALTLDGGFAFDDSAAILHNPVVLGEVGFGEALTRDFWGQPLSNAQASWRPLLPMLWRGLYALGDGAAWPFRALSLLLHVGATGALWWLLRRIGVGASLACAVTTLFAVHPARSEGVGAIVAHADVLSAGLVFLGLGALVRGRGWAFGGLLALACLAKESAVVAAPVGLLMLWATPGVGIGSALRRTAPAWTVALAVAAFQLSFERTPAGPFDNLAYAAEGFDRLRLAAHALGRGLGMTLLPTRLSPHHGYAEVDLSWGTLAPWGALGVLGAAFGLALLGWGVRRRRPQMTLAVALWLAPLGLQTNLLFLLPTDLAERLLYPALGGAMLAAGLAASRWLQAPRLRGLVLGSVLLVFGAGSVAAQRPWRDDASLWTWAAAQTPQVLRVQRNLAAIRFRSGRFEDGLWHFMLAQHIQDHLPNAVPWEAVEPLEQLPVSERLVSAPGQLAPDAPCEFALRWLNAAFRDPDRALAMWSYFTERYGCPTLGPPPG